MNENDMDRYFWRTGQRWSGDDRRIKASRTGLTTLSNRMILFLVVGFALTVAALLFQR
jgi:hypothetical protein